MGKKANKINGGLRCHGLRVLSHDFKSRMNLWMNVLSRASRQLPSYPCLMESSFNLHLFTTRAFYLAILRGIYHQVKRISTNCVGRSGYNSVNLDLKILSKGGSFREMSNFYQWVMRIGCKVWEVPWIMLLLVALQVKLIVIPCTWKFLAFCFHSGKEFPPELLLSWLWISNQKAVIGYCSRR